MSRVLGRSDDMLIIRGVNVFPSQIETVLFEIEGTEPHYQIVVDRKGAMDEATVLVEVAESIFFDQMRRQKEMVERIQKRLAQELGVSFDGEAGREEDAGAVRGQGQAGGGQPENLEQAAEKGPSAALARLGTRCGVPPVRLARALARRLASGPF